MNMRLFKPVLKDNYFKEIEPSLAEYVCTFDHLDLVKDLLVQYSLPKYSIRISNAIFRTGNDAFAVHLNTVGLLPKMVFSYACIHGSMFLIRFCLDHAESTPFDIECGFYLACHTGRIKVASMLKDIFPNRIQNVLFIALSYACHGGHIHVVEWLWKYMKVSNLYMRPYLMGAISSGSKTVVNWVFSHGGLVQDISERMVHRLENLPRD